MAGEWTEVAWFIHTTENYSSRRVKPYDTRLDLKGHTKGSHKEKDKFWVSSCVKQRRKKKQTQLNKTKLLSSNAELR